MLTISIAMRSTNSLILTFFFIKTGIWMQLTRNTPANSDILSCIYVKPVLLLDVYAECEKLSMNSNHAFRSLSPSEPICLFFFPSVSSILIVFKKCRHSEHVDLCFHQSMWRPLVWRWAHSLNADIDLWESGPKKSLGTWWNRFMHRAVCRLKAFVLAEDTQNVQRRGFVFEGHLPSPAESMTKGCGGRCSALCLPLGKSHALSVSVPTM